MGEDRRETFASLARIPNSYLAKWQVVAMTLYTMLSTHPLVFFLNDTSTTEIYTLSLHDALPIYGRVLVLGSSGATTQILEPVVAGNAIVSGTVKLAWQIFVTPDLAGYPTSYAGDLWSFTLDSAPVLVAPVPAEVDTVAELLAYLAAALAGADGAGGITATVQPDGSILLGGTGGALIQAGNLKWIRVTPHDAAQFASDPDGRAHYTQVVMDLNPSAGDITKVSTGEQFKVVLNGVEFIYKVEPLLQGPGAGERNLNTVAARLAALIDASAIYDAVADGTKIRVFDAQRTSPNGVDPIVFSAERGGVVHAVIDIDNTRLVRSEEHTSELQ